MSAWRSGDMAFECWEARVYSSAEQMSRAPLRLEPAHELHCR